MDRCMHWLERDSVRDMHATVQGADVCAASVPETRDCVCCDPEHRRHDRCHGRSTRLCTVSQGRHGGCAEGGSVASQDRLVARQDARRD